MSSIERANLRIAQIQERLLRYPRAAKDQHLLAALEDLEDIINCEVQERGTR